MDTEISLQGGAQITSTQWSVEDNTVEALDLEYQFNASGTFPVCLEITAENSLGPCTDVVCKDVEVAAFTCLIKADFEVNTSDCGIEALWSGFAASTTEATLMNWTLDGISISDNEAFSHTLEDAQTAILCLEVEGASSGAACSATHCVELIGSCPETTTGIQDTTESGQIAVYPNPAQDAVTVQTPGLQSVQLYNLSGALVLESGNATMDVSQLPAGLYFVKAITETGLVQSQLIVQ